MLFEKKPKIYLLIQQKIVLKGDKKITKNNQTNPI